IFDAFLKESTLVFQLIQLTLKSSNYMWSRARRFSFCLQVVFLFVDFFIKFIRCNLIFFLNIIQKCRIFHSSLYVSINTKFNKVNYTLSKEKLNFIRRNILSRQSLCDVANDCIILSSLFLQLLLFKMFHLLQHLIANKM